MQSKIDKKRIEWVDIGKYICIMFVMLSHLESNTRVLELFYTPFFLSVFFFLSGYVYRPSNSFKEHLSKKARGLFVPWLIFSNLNIALSMVMTLKGGRNYWSEFLWNLLQIRGHGDGVWFVSALFVAFIPFYFVIKWGQPKKAIALAFALSITSVIYKYVLPINTFPWGDANLPWHLEYIFQAMFWMVLGYYFKNVILNDGITAEQLLDKYNIGFYRAIVWAFYLMMSYISEKIGGGYAIICLPYIRSILGIVAIISLCKSLKSNRYIRFVGANTLTFFALHGKLYAVIEKVLGKFSFYHSCLENVLASSLIAIGITIVMSVILIIPAMIINRWFPWVLGKKKNV